MIAATIPLSKASFERSAQDHFAFRLRILRDAAKAADGDVVVRGRDVTPRQAVSVTGTKKKTTDRACLPHPPFPLVFLTWVRGVTAAYPFNFANFKGH